MLRVGEGNKGISQLKEPQARNSCISNVPAPRTAVHQTCRPRTATLRFKLLLPVPHSARAVFTVPLLENRRWVEGLPSPCLKLLQKKRCRQARSGLELVLLLLLLVLILVVQLLLGGLLVLNLIIVLVVLPVLLGLLGSRLVLLLLLVWGGGEIGDGGRAKSSSEGEGWKTYGCV